MLIECFCNWSLPPLGIFDCLYLIGIMHVAHTWSVHSLTHMQPLTQIRDVHGIFVTGLAFVILPRAADKPVSPGGREQVALVSVSADRLCCVTSIGEEKGILILYMEWIHALTTHVHCMCAVHIHVYMYLYRHCVWLRTCIYTCTVVSWVSTHGHLVFKPKWGLGAYMEKPCLCNVLIVVYQSCSDCLPVCCLGVMSSKLLVLVLSLLVVILAMMIHSLWTWINSRYVGMGAGTLRVPHSY